MSWPRNWPTRLPRRRIAFEGRLPSFAGPGPDDIGDAAVFLLAPAADCMHGAVMPVNGGWR